jgi:hypothetical protein
MSTDLSIAIVCGGASLSVQQPPSRVTDESVKAESVLLVK